ncbi:glycosyltransferase family 39 protein [Thiomicrorhabdus sp. ZW0627]|uniref:ArnT family glycosyltransferase n=1 Tax=Thiomicrorhabdus sp. ZW0627 TaxID=3039774 RepID=UPI002436FAB3|nr:glycosyltransferase family 39 protein [Thiomicrorhabdus sp. ZW0627]MDG6773949.1 glycosyltransferase family 39 protein [Thiomicrorhabdus sp. ZW0627]
MTESKHLKPHQAAFLLVGLMTLVHIVLAFNTELGGDEAHYALYGLMPDWSYFDHPPMVGWLQIIPMWLFPTDWGARIVPISLYIILNYLLYQITVRLFAQNEQACSDSKTIWTGFASLLLLNATLMFPLMGMGQLPDNPLMVVVLAMVWLVWEMLKTEIPSTKQWLLLGCLVGLAALSKYTSITIVVSLLLVMMVEKRWYWLTQKGLWLAILIALVITAPLLYWNAIHDWASFLYQLHHGTHNPDWRIVRFLRSQAAQFIVYTPLLFILGWWMMLKVRNYRSPATRLLLLFAVPVFVLFAWGSGREESLPHWPALAWLLLIPVVIDWLWQRRAKLGVKIVIGLQLALSLVLTVVMHSFLFTPWIPFEDHKNPIQGEYGWKQAAATAKEIQAELSTDKTPLPLFVSNWSYASHLTWYVRPQPVYVTTARQTQFEFWFGKAKAGMDGILVVPHYEKIPPLTNQPNHFERCDLVKKLPIRANDSIIVSYYFYRCSNYLQ